MSHDCESIRFSCGNLVTFKLYSTYISDDVHQEKMQIKILIIKTFPGLFSKIILLPFRKFNL